MSTADFALLCGIAIAVAGVTRYGRTLSGLLRVVAAYEVLMLVVVAAHPTPLAITEWLHRAALMAGGLLVGAAIARHGRIALAIRAFVAMSTLFAVAAVYGSATTGFGPAYPLGVHKNAAGSLLAMAIALVATVPVDAGISMRIRRWMYVVCGIGLFATRSRGAILGLGFVLLVWAVAQRGRTRLRFVAIVTAVIGTIFVWGSVQSELRTDVYGFGSIGTRERQHAQAWSAFETDTVVGAGIRYYDSVPALAKDGRPSSTLYEALGESGYVGAAGLALIVLGPLLVLRRSGSRWAVVGMAVYGVRAVHGVFDNFFVAGPLTFPWLILGIAAAAELAGRAEPDADTETLEQTPALTPAP